MAPVDSVGQEICLNFILESLMRNCHQNSKSGSSCCS